MKNVQEEDLIFIPSCMCGRDVILMPCDDVLRECVNENIAIPFQKQLSECRELAISVGDFEMLWNVRRKTMPIETFRYGFYPMAYVDELGRVKVRGQRVQALSSTDKYAQFSMSLISIKLEKDVSTHFDCVVLNNMFALRTNEIRRLAFIESGSAQEQLAFYADQFGDNLRSIHTLQAYSHSFRQFGDINLVEFDFVQPPCLLPFVLLPQNET